MRYAGVMMAVMVMTMMLMRMNVIMAVVVVALMIMVCGTFSFFLHPEHIFFFNINHEIQYYRQPHPKLKKKFYIESMRSCFVHASLKGRVRLPNQMNFRKNSKRPSTPPLIFGKLCCKFFIMDMVAFMRGGIGQIVSVNIS